MTRLIAKALIIVILLALLVPSCTSTNIELTDALGRMVKLDKVPERIVSLAPSNTEILFALGLEDKVVGITSYCNYPAEAEEKPTVGGFSTVDLEKVLAQDPDLILAANKHQGAVIDQLESYGLNVMALAPGTVGEVMQAIDMVGRATGKESEARTLLEEMQSRLAIVDNLVKDLSDEERPTVFYALRPDPLLTVGHDTVISHIIDLAGGENVFDDLAQYATVDLEVLIERDPQIIIANLKHGSDKQTTLDWAQSEDRIEGTKARENGNVFGIDSDIVSRPGPRIVDAVEEMLRLIHPDLAVNL